MELPETRRTRTHHTYIHGPITQIGLSRLFQTHDDPRPSCTCSNQSIIQSYQVFASSKGCQDIHHWFKFTCITHTNNFLLHRHFLFSFNALRHCPTITFVVFCSSSQLSHFIPLSSSPTISILLLKYVILFLFFFNT